MKIYDGNKNDTTDRVSQKYLEINSVGIQSVYPFRTVRERGRTDFSLFYIEKGKCSFVRNNDVFAVYGGGFFIYHPHEKQDYCGENDTVCFWLHFSGKAVSELLADSSLDIANYYKGGAASPEVVGIFQKMLYDYNTVSPARSASLIADLTAFLATLGKKKSNEKTAYDERLETVLSKMHREFSLKKDIAAYALEYGVSKSRFIHVFKESFGVSPYAYLTSLRLLRGAELLRDTRLTVSQIAYEIGFSDPLNFSRIFKKYYGASPEKFRKSSDGL